MWATSGTPSHPTIFCPVGCWLWDGDGMKGGTVMIVIWGSLFLLIIVLFIRLIIRERQKKKRSDDPDQLR